MKSSVGFCWIYPPFARKIEKRPSHTLFFHREYIYRVIESSIGVLLYRQFRAVSLSFLYSQGSMGIMGGLLELVLENYQQLLAMLWTMCIEFFLYFSVCIISKALLLLYRHCVFIRLGRMSKISLRIRVFFGCLELFMTTFQMTSK